MMDRTELIERLRAEFDYNPETGVLRRTVATKGYFAGHVTGSPKQPDRPHLRMTAFGVRMYVHQAIWAIVTGKWPDGVVDHRDGDPTNNRWNNLRACTQAENVRNQKKQKDSASPFKGAHLDKRDGRWSSHICVNKKTTYLGRFATAEEAHAAYRVAATRLHGEFARFE